MGVVQHSLHNLDHPGGEEPAVDALSRVDPHDEANPFFPFPLRISKGIKFQVPTAKKGEIFPLD
jgi:hypothetical protein